MEDAKMIQEAYQRLIDTYLASPHRKDRKSTRLNSKSP